MPNRALITLITLTAPTTVISLVHNGPNDPNENNLMALMTIGERYASGAFERYGHRRVREGRRKAVRDFGRFVLGLLVLLLGLLGLLLG